MASSHPSENGVDGDDEREEDDEEEEEEEEEEAEEEEEPRLKYQRMGGSLPSLLSTDAAASIAIAERMIALGTHDGTVHILDFQGNQVMLFLGFRDLRLWIWELFLKLTFFLSTIRFPEISFLFAEFEF